MTYLNEAVFLSKHLAAGPPVFVIICQIKLLSHLRIPEAFIELTHAIRMFEYNFLTLFVFYWFGKYTVLCNCNSLLLTQGRAVIAMTLLNLKPLPSMQEFNR